MVNPNAKTRLSTINFVAEVEMSGFWKENPLVALVEGLDGFELRSDGEKSALLRTIKDAAEGGSLPEAFLIHRVLPSLLHSLSLPNAPSALMLPLVLAIGKNVPPSTYAKVVLEPVVKLYASPDRGTRMALLEGLDQYGDKLDNKTVNERVWPNLITGFADTVPILREATIKAVYPLAPKLSDRILNNELLRLLAKMQTDTEPSIRTNTCILLGRLAPMLGPNTKKKVLVPAFARSLKDSFVHARVAALMALMATAECFDRDDLAARVIPNMSFALVDKEKVVRDQAFKALNMFVKRLEDEVASMVSCFYIVLNSQRSQQQCSATRTPARRTVSAPLPRPRQQTARPQSVPLPRAWASRSSRPQRAQQVLWPDGPSRPSASSWPQARQTRP
jgi:SCY1-like protein 1